MDLAQRLLSYGNAAACTTGRAAAAMVSMTLFVVLVIRGKRYDTMTYVRCLTLYIGIPLVHKVYPKLVQKYLVQLWVRIGTLSTYGLGTLFVPKVGIYFWVS